MAAHDEQGGIMKYGDTEESISERKKVGRMKNAWIWIAMALIVLAAAGCVSKPSDMTKNETVTTPTTTVPPTSTPGDEMQNVVIELPSSIKLQSLGAYSSSNGTISIPKNLYIHDFRKN